MGVRYQFATSSIADGLIVGPARQVAWRGPLLATNFISDLEKAIAERSADTSGMLRQITDLFLANAGHYSDEQIGVYDDVLQLLIARVDIAARATLARRSEERR